MRIGSTVTREFIDEVGIRETPEDEPRGVVIAIEMDEDIPERATVRWENGLVESLTILNSEWDLIDVTPLLYANLYLHDREYGGPEEGGWFYDTYSPIDDAWYDEEPPKHGHFDTEEAAQAATEALKAWCEDQNSRRRSPSSVLSEGHFVVRLEQWPAERDPKQRPYYC